MSDSSLVSKWRSYLSSSAVGLHLVDNSHPLRFFIGTTEQGRPRAAIRCDVKPRMLTLSDVVLVERFEDQSGKWNFSLTLQDPKFTEVFLRLVDDMHARSADAPNELVAMDRVAAVIDEWRRLLKARPSGLLSMEELRGLVGELWLLLNEFNSSRTIAASIDGWLGPLGLPQDFWFSDDGYHEAKSTGPATTHIKISSEFQLDSDALSLLVLLVANTAEQTAGAVNLPTLCNRVVAALASEALGDEALNERLARLGVDLKEPFYHDTWFVVSRVTRYEVRPEFPAIRASSIGHGISRVKYQIDLAAIEEFKLSSTEVV